MEETKRFIRYMLPGLLVLVESVIYVLYAASDVVLPKLAAMEKGLPILASVAVLSVGAGFLLSVVYHSLLGTWFVDRLAVNHVSLLKAAIDAGLLRLHNRTDNQKVTPHGRKEAWRVVMSYWYARMNSSKIIKGANARVDSLTDIVNGLGTAFIGSLVAIPVWVVVHDHLARGYPPWWSYFLPVAACLFHLANFLRAKNDCQSFIDSLVWQALLV